MANYDLYARMFITGEIASDLLIKPINIGEQFTTINLKIDDSKKRYKVILYNLDAITAFEKYRKGDILNCVLVPIKSDDKGFIYNSEYMKLLNR